MLWEGSKTNYYTLKEILNNHSAVDLKKMGQFIKLKGYYKMKKDDLVEAISDYILEDNNLEACFLVASDNDIEVFEEALKGSITTSEPALYSYWEDLFLAFITVDGEVDIPLEVKEQYLRIKKRKGYKETREKNKVIHSYGLACTNLYSLIHVDKLVEIINAQSSLTVDRDDVIIWCRTRESCGNDSLYFYEEGYIINESYRYEGSGDELKYEDMLKMQEGKPYYIPDKEELLRYVDDRYIDENDSFNSLLNYMRTKLKIRAAQAYEYCAAMQIGIRNGSMPSEVLDYCERRGLDLRSKKLAEGFMKHFAKMFNSTRMPENNGYTPDEIASFSADMETVSIADNTNNTVDSAQSYDSEANVIKIPRNSPCPCGSGKKYKKCCGGNS